MVRCSGVVLASVLLVLAQLAAAQFTTEPSPIIQGLPFRVRTDDASFTNVFVSISPACASVISGTQQALVGGTAELDLGSNAATNVYLCNSLSATQIQPLELFPIKVSPPYIFLNEASELEFTAVTPIGSTIELRQLADCTGDTYATAPLPASRKVSFTMSSGFFVFVCARFDHLGSERVVTADQVKVTDKPTFFPLVAITNENVTFTTAGSAPPNTQVAISDSPACDNILQGPYTTSEGLGKSATLEVVVPKGVYHFCIFMTSGSFYVSGGTLTISQYRIIPTTLYAGLATRMLGSLDTPRGGRVILSGSNRCSQPYILDTLSSAGDGSFSWTVGTTGTYFACVLKPATTTFLLANQIDVVPAPIVSTPSLAVRGLMTSISVTSTVPANVTIAGNTCGNAVVTGPLPSDGTFSFVVPVQSTLLYPSLIVCLTLATGVESEAALYDIGRSFEIRSFQFSHSPILAGRPIVLTFDPATPESTPYRFSSSDSCADGDILAMPSTRRAQLTFAQPATLNLCVRAGAVFLFIREVTVYDVVEAETVQFLADRPNSVRINRTFDGQTVFIAPSCDQRDAAIAEGTAIGTMVDLTFNTPNASMLVLCGVYKNSTGQLATESSTAIEVFRVQFAPTLHVRGQTSSIRLHSYFAGAITGASVHISDSTCPASTPVAGPTNITSTGSDAVVNFILMELGTYRVCLVLIDGPVLDLGSLEIIEAPVPKLPDIADAGIFRGVPFTFTVNDPYVPAVFRLSHLPDCTIANYSGTFDSAGLSSVVVPTELGTLSLCISSDDGVTLFRIAGIEIITIQATRQRFVRGSVADLGSTPVLPSNYSLALYASPVCAGSPIALNPVTAPIGIYTMCASLTGTDYKIMANTSISIIDVYLAQFPTSVKTQVEYTFTVTGGDISATGDPNAILFVPTGTPCLASTEVYPFTGTSVVASTSQPAGISVDVCVRTKDGTNAQVLATIPVLPYMNPTSIAKGFPTSFTSGSFTTGFAKLSLTADCSDIVSNLVPIANGVASDVLVPLTVTSNMSTYCEQLSATGPFISRGPVEMFGTFKPDPNGTTPDIDVITVAAGEAFTLQVLPEAGSNPFLSRFRSCNDTVEREFDYYIPSESEDSRFFICILSPDGSLNYTNPEPSLIVNKFTLTPKAVRRFVNEPAILAPSPPAQRLSNVYLSESEECTMLSPSVPFSGGNTSLFANYTTGKRWMCMTFRTSHVAIASFVVVEPPVVLGNTNLLFGAAFCLEMTVPEYAYSLFDGGDVNFPFGSYYTTTQRTLYIAQSACSGPALSIGTVSAIGANFSVCFIAPPRTTAGPNAYAVCATTPAGILPTADTISFEVNATNGVEPKEFVSGGSDIPIHIPGAPRSTFKLSSSDCSTQVSANFTTNATGFGTISTIGLNQFFIPAGVYSLCMLGPDNKWYPVYTVTVVGPSYFSISNDVVVAGVDTPIVLLQDLRAPMLMPGLYATESCIVPITTISYSTTSDTGIVIHADEEGVSGFLCAVAPVNGTRIAVSRISSVSSNGVLQFDAVGVVCQQMAIVTANSDPAASIYLALADCCANTIVVKNATAVEGTTTDFRLLLTETELDIFSGRRLYPLCYANASVCLQLGTVNYVLKDCESTRDTLPPLPSDSPNAAGVIGGAVPVGEDEDYTMLWIAIILFAILLCVVLIVFALHQMMKGNKVVPADDGPEDLVAVERESGWKHTFDDLYASNRVKANRSHVFHTVLDVPVDLSLDNCHELPLAIQDLITEEEIQRREIEDSERYVVDHIVSSFHAGMAELHTYYAAMERTQYLFQIHEEYRVELENVAEDEGATRFALEEQEQEVRLSLSEVERGQWRHQMELQRQRLYNSLERDPFWRDRRQDVQSANQSAISLHLDGGGASPNPMPVSGASRHSALPPLEYPGSAGSRSTLDPMSTHSVEVRDMTRDSAYGQRRRY